MLEAWFPEPFMVAVRSSGKPLAAGFEAFFSSALDSFYVLELWL